ncbi:MAG: LamG-like jellyroll fold domain-containing protein [Methylicorpusculum sp.]|uniref:LamG-like jellyroll fold domain-containing protein n=1 Tax=Methylicorpusculum sp. TaxID=2713644 RepID=UPI0027223B9F|nr:LamG-like jellyroll fold domain-containing protein [Methylicorpusculum sp.]MDO8940913.1 LamG-like jellyroll fold domain-containing protein [Methylicorpusculum sp.]MDP2202396.1 LamG-like jellyroll fold domain-containing protein [Methylicorpusculum sp.]
MAIDPHWDNVLLCLVATHSGLIDVSKFKNPVYLRSGVANNFVNHNTLVPKLVDAPANMISIGRKAVLLPVLDGSIAAGRSIHTRLPEALGTGNLTIECWVRPTVSGGTTASNQFGRIITIGTHLGNGNLNIIRNSVDNPFQARCELANSGSFHAITGTSGAPNDTPAHLALVRESGNWKWFINGVLISTTSLQGGLSLGLLDFNMGCIYVYTSPWNAFNGHVSGVRVTKNVARYSASFTSPLRQFSKSDASFAGHIDESLAATEFVATLIDAATNLIHDQVTVNTEISPDFTLNYFGEDRYYVTVVPTNAKKWAPSTIYALNAQVIPDNPIATPYYYKRLSAGTSGTTEPTWPTTPGGRCNDGAVTDAWELVERLSQPITHGPLTPT